ncbi:MAG: FprA family A-type flavoprotein [Fervidicoccaceae archaeon]
MTVGKIARDLYVLRCEDHEKRYFDALWEIPEGITYNSYLLRTREGSMLFDGCSRRLLPEFLEALRELVDFSELKFVVVNHAEPDHSGSLPEIISRAENATVLGTEVALDLLDAFYGVRERVSVVSEEESIELGGVELRFHRAPWVHWPDAMVTYVGGFDALITCDLFGGFSIPRTLTDVSDEVVEEYLPFVRKYVAAVVGHYRDHLARAAEKIRRAYPRVSSVLPGHGLLWLRSPSRIIDCYERWARGEAEPGKVTIVYASMYGALEEAALAVAEELEKRGKSVSLHIFNDELRGDLSELISDVSDSEALAVGAATYENDVHPLARCFVDLIAHKLRFERPALVISSYGWRGAAGRLLAEALSKAGYRVVDVVEFRGSLTPETRSRLVEAVDKLVRAVSSGVEKELTSNSSRLGEA